jgi:hypothetical protein
MALESDLLLLHCPVNCPHHRFRYTKHLRQFSRPLPRLVQLINLHIPLRWPFWLGFQVLARLFPLDHEGGQDRTGRHRTPNAAGRERIQREGIPDARLIVPQLDFGDETGCLNKKLLSYSFIRQEFEPGAPTEIRTLVLALKGLRPGPLDDGGIFIFNAAGLYHSAQFGSRKKQGFC